MSNFSPVESALKRNRVVTYAASSAATPFDVLRTKIVLQMRKNGWKRLAITSPNPGCGKTTMCCNLTVGLSRQPDIRTILFELDLRKPAVAKMLGHAPGADITEMLTGKVAFGEQAMRLRENVAFSIANRPTPDPMRYLLSEETDQHLRVIEGTYQPDLMIFDLPPILAADDTRAVLSKVDCALIVIRSEKTTVAQIDACEREIAEHTNVLGMVVNQCRFPDSAGYEDY
ncbi:MAG: CpsD/CapB family tyrosine-protein kinase [Pseudomonadota bacterium]